MPAEAVIVIGSGPAGAHAADELASRGIPVVMIDGGSVPKELLGAPTENFEDVRRGQEEQARWFLGHDLSGIPVSGLTGGLGGGQVSGNRAYVVAGTKEELPLHEERCQIVQSLALGGLGAAWGAACGIPEDFELRAMGLSPEILSPHFATVIRKIGVSGMGNHPDLQPPLPLDLHGENGRKAFEKKRGWFEKERLVLAQPLSAVLTRDLGARKASTLADMDYWADSGKSVYRPQYTVDELRESGKLRYVGNAVVQTLTSTSDGNVRVTWKHRGTESEETMEARRVILAAGAIGSGRIALRSLGGTSRTLPLAAKPHVFSACVDLRSLGKAGPKERTSLCQLVLIDEKPVHAARAGLAQLYGYRSLMLFRLLTSQPLPVPEALSVLAALTPSLVIADIRFPALPTGTMRLREDGVMEIRCTVSENERRERNVLWKRIRRGLRALGFFPVRNMELPEGSSSHYAGTLPYEKNGGDLTTDANGNLRGIPGVAVADASVFPMLPAIPHTLTIMANARRVAAEVASSL